VYSGKGARIGEGFNGICKGPFWTHSKTIGEFSFILTGFSSSRIEEKKKNQGEPRPAITNDKFKTLGCRLEKSKKHQMGSLLKKKEEPSKDQHACKVSRCRE